MNIDETKLAHITECFKPAKWYVPLVELDNTQVGQYQCLTMQPRRGSHVWCANSFADLSAPNSHVDSVPYTEIGRSCRGCLSRRCRRCPVARLQPKVVFWREKVPFGRLATNPWPCRWGMTAFRPWGICFVGGVPSVRSSARSVFGSVVWRRSVRWLARVLFGSYFLEGKVSLAAFRPFARSVSVWQSCLDGGELFRSVWN